MALVLACGNMAARLSGPSIRRFAVVYSCRALAKEAVNMQFYKTYSSYSAKKDFKIRPIETEKEFESVIINPMAKEGWRPGLKDAECFLACDPSRALVGELNGKPICSIKLTKYSESFVFSGCYMVNKEYRGKGYALKMTDAAFDYAKQSSANIGIVSEKLHAERAYKRWGFRSLFYGSTFVFHPPTALTRRPETSERSVQIKNISEVNLKAFFTYDTDVFGFERHAFLSKWLRVTGSFTRVAINSEGSIVGYTVARPTFVQGEGYKIGPLFADSEPIAGKLLKAVFEELLQQGEPVVCIDAPTEKAIKLCEKLQGKRVFDIVYMVKNDPPSVRFDKWYGYTTTQLG